MDLSSLSVQEQLLKIRQTNAEKSRFRRLVQRLLETPEQGVRRRAANARYARTWRERKRAKAAQAKGLVDNQAMEIPSLSLPDITVTPIPMNTASVRTKPETNVQPIPLATTTPVTTTHQSGNIRVPSSSADHLPLPGAGLSASQNLSKYAQLLLVIEEMSRDIRPTYSGSRSSAERLKRGIVHARILVRECLLETERSARQ